MDRTLATENWRFERDKEASDRQRRQDRLRLATTVGISIAIMVVVFGLNYVWEDAKLSRNTSSLLYEQQMRLQEMQKQLEDQLRNLQPQGKTTK